MQHTLSSKKSDATSNPRKEKPTDQEFPPPKGIHKQKKPVVRAKKAKSHKAIQ